VNGRKGKWTSVEDSKLKDAVQTHGDKDWAAMSALVPSRTKHQCQQRWKMYMDPKRSTVRGKEHDTLKKAPGLGQDSHSP
jgi:myb proto-oncogene protein